jgi:hypothetical protein
MCINIISHLTVEQISIKMSRQEVTGEQHV